MPPAHGGSCWRQQWGFELIMLCWICGVSRRAAEIMFPRLLAIALILDGGSRSDAAKIAGFTLQIVPV